MNEQGMNIATCYGPVARKIMDCAAEIRLVICDVDGVLSDGLIYMGNNGEELKAFNVRDGYGIRCLITEGIHVAIITGRQSKLVADRATTLGIEHLYQGQSDKLIAFEKILADLNLQPHQVSYIGDDLIDWPVMAKVGLSVAVADAHPIYCSALNMLPVFQAGAVQFVSYAISSYSRRANWMRPKGYQYE